MQRQPAHFGGFPPLLALPSSLSVASPLPMCSVDQLILLGSPLGCFLALRGVSHAHGTGLGSPASAPLMQVCGALCLFVMRLQC